MNYICSVQDRRQNQSSDRAEVTETKIKTMASSNKYTKWPSQREQRRNQHRQRIQHRDDQAKSKQAVGIKYQIIRN